MARRRAPPCFPLLLFGGAVLCALVLLWVAAPAAAVVPGREPNDDPANATQLDEGVLGHGVFYWSHDTDFWRLDLAGPALLRVWVEIEEGGTGTGGTYVTLEDGDANTLPGVWHNDEGQAPALWSVQERGGTVFVHFLALQWGINYTIRWNASTDFAQLEGPDEQEPNGGLQTAQHLLLGTNRRGYLNSDWGDVDVYSVSSASDGWLLVDTGDRFPRHVSVSDGNQVRSDRSYGSPFPRVYAVTRGETLFIALSLDPYYGSVDFGARSYNITVTYTSDLSTLWQGADETEPNNQASQADAVGGQFLVSARIDSDQDPVDYFKVESGAGEILNITLVTSGRHSPPVRISCAVNGTPLEWETSYGTDRTYQSALFFTQRPTAFLIEVQTDLRNQSYQLTFEHAAAGLANPQAPLLEDVLAADGLGAWVGPDATPPVQSIRFLDPFPGSSPAGANLVRGEGLMYGDTLCLTLGVQGGLDGVVVQPGAFYLPEEEVLQSLVTSRYMVIDVPSGGRACLRAVSHNETGLLGWPGDRYRFSGYVDGDQLAVIGAINETGSDHGSGQLAFWATTSGTAADRAKRWGADDGMIQGAQELLDHAGVRTPLNPDPLPMVIIAGIALSVLSIALVAIRSRRRAAPPGRQPAQQSAGKGPATPARAASPSARDTILGAAPQEDVQPAPDDRPPQALPLYPCPRCLAPVPYGWPQCPRCMQPLWWGRP